MENKIFKLDFGGKELVIEISDLAEQANGSCLTRMGGTVVLTTAVMSKSKREGLDFFPLTVEYEEKYYAAGKIKGPRYIKRESRPSDEAICNARLIDRAVRPRFPENLGREVQIVNTVLSWDSENDPDILGIIGSSLSILISDIPWSGPISTVRVAKVEDKFILNPTYEEREKSEIDVVFSAAIGSFGKEKDVLINMIEGGFEEKDENLILEAFEFAKEGLKKCCDFQKEISKNSGKEKTSLENTEPDRTLEKEIREFLGDNLEKNLFQKDKTQRNIGLNNLREEVVSFVKENYDDYLKIKQAQIFFENEVKRLLEENIVEKGKRPDFREIDEIREINLGVGILPRTHGSAVFQRGQTKTLSILTLGAPGDQQLLEGMEVVGKKRFMHHYNFPPYSVGEIRPLRGPGRRDIGHGMLVEKALLPLIPSFEDFPYTMRVVSEVLSSNGSSSMASVSSASLALMDAGVPIKKPAAGIALGLAKDKKGNYKILTDIQGPEDHYGNMDFKVAGTREGITAIQMDVKMEGINKEILADVLERGKGARNKILDAIEKVLPEPRPELSPFAPRILTIQIDPEKIREVIGPGGKVIQEIVAETGAIIDVQDTGLIFITSEKEEGAKKALSWIKDIVREVEVGEFFQGKVKRILDFGAFVEILPGQEGMIHISQLAPHRVKKVEDVVKIGDVISVKVISVDELGRINLSLNKQEIK